MSWEAFRLTSKTPSQLLSTLGPHGVDDLMRQALNAVWRDYPVETRSYTTARKAAAEVFNRNMKVWSAIKKPRPDAFFADLGPSPADGFMRQAFVLCWMMLPRVGGRNFKQTHGILQRMFERNMQAWEADNRTFTKGTAARTTRKPVPKKSEKRLRR
jgi:hypothetical protein